jgi:D-alanyl-lipoteichoic acid acyltransferase DltB (MBOAT superfamily)
LVLSTVLDFWFGLSLSRATAPRQRQGWLLASLGVNLGILGFFKYYDFFAGSAVTMLHRFGLSPHPPLLHVLLPVGISFYTFHGISYVFDVYRGHIEPTRRPLDYAVFVAFFPQLVAGPIGRAQLQLPQFGRERVRPNGEEVGRALGLILVGLFKKVVIADGMATFVTATFAQANKASALTLITAAWGFALQIYGDFSGYTDIARGSARLLGIDLPVNFRQPYLSRNITEFWRRWHISLSNWLRDYLYIPLGGNRGAAWATYRNLMITMLLGGLWHGASWTFVVWGALHGAFLAVDRFRGADRSDAHRPLAWRDIPSVLLTANLACAAFVVFRASSFRNATQYFHGILSGRGGLSIDRGGLLLVLGGALAVLAIDLAQRRAREVLDALTRRPELLGAAVGAAVVAIVVFSGGAPVPFIYFRF